MDYCTDLVRDHDPDRFLISLYFSEQVSADLRVLFAFHHEIAKTREVVTETMLGHIRLQWWRDALDGLYKDEPDILEHEVIQPLADVIQRYDLPQKDFLDLIYAREFDLEDVAPSSLDGLKKYAEFTQTPLLRLCLRISGQERLDDDAMIKQVAINFGVIGLLRSVVFHARQRRHYLPDDLMRRYDVRADKLYELKAQEGLAHVIEASAALYQKYLTPKARILRLCQGLSRQYHTRLKALNYDVFDPAVTLPPAFKELRLLWASHFG